jgi:hypothetical protein
MADRRAIAVRVGQERRAKRARRPRCTILVEHRDGSVTACGAITDQNEVERSRGVYWCPVHQRYPWGSGGGRAGGGPDKVPAEAWPA